MGLFTKSELIIMLAIFGSIFLIVLVLTILDIIDEKKEKKLNKEIENELETFEEVKEEMVEVEEVNSIPETTKVEETVIENNIEDKSVVENIIEEIDFEEEEILFEEVPTKVEINYDNIVPTKKEKASILDTIEQEISVESNFENTILNFELEQEENAIISYDELVKVSNQLYDENEIMQYDDGDEPITIEEVMMNFNTNNSVETDNNIVDNSSEVKLETVESE